MAEIGLKEIMLMQELGKTVHSVFCNSQENLRITIKRLKKRKPLTSKSLELRPICPTFSIAVTIRIAVKMLTETNNLRTEKSLRLIRPQKTLRGARKTRLSA